MNYKDQLKFNCGKKLKYRIVQAPMVTKGAALDGSVSEKNLPIMVPDQKLLGRLLWRLVMFTRQVKDSSNKLVFKMMTKLQV